MNWILLVFAAAFLMVAGGFIVDFIEKARGPGLDTVDVLLFLILVASVIIVFFSIVSRMTV